jgi:hypothetical protein
MHVPPFKHVTLLDEQIPPTPKALSILEFLSHCIVEIVNKITVKNRIHFIITIL